MNPVYITRLSKFLPNGPVSNNEMEDVLGKINDTPSKAKNIVLRNNGIKNRYYAHRNNKPTHGNAEMAALAIRGLFDEQLPISSLEVLSTGTSTPDQLVPSQASMVHGELGIHPIELMAASGTCCSSMQALKYAYLFVGSGAAKVAAAVGSEKVSSWLHSSRFEAEVDNLATLEKDPIIAFDKDFLRWMLSDGAAAVLLQDHPNVAGVSLRIDWIEIKSYAGEMQTCMMAGGMQNEDKSITGWADVSEEEYLTKSVFSLRQDTKLLGSSIVEYGGKFLKELMEKYNLQGEEIDYFLPHMSSEFFKQKIDQVQKQIGMNLPFEKWFYNLPDVGNVGSASAFLMLQALMQDRNLQKGQHILVMVPESARFTYAYMHLTVV